jgi:hypothetical protein
MMQKTFNKHINNKVNVNNNYIENYESYMKTAEIEASAEEEEGDSLGEIDGHQHMNRKRSSVRSYNGTLVDSIDKNKAPLLNDRRHRNFPLKLLNKSKISYKEAMEEYD